MSLCSGDIVYFLNAGDSLHDHHVLSEVSAFFEQWNCDAAFGNLMPTRLGSEIGDHPAFRPGRLIDYSYFNNRRRFFDECVHHQTTFYRLEILQKCSFFDQSMPDATGEYLLNCCAFVECGFRLFHIPRLICNFALGGSSTLKFEDEWPRFQVARFAIRRRFFPNGPLVPIPTRNEFLLNPPSYASRIRILCRDFGQLASGNYWPVRLSGTLSRWTSGNVSLHNIKVSFKHTAKYLNFFRRRPTMIKRRLLSDNELHVAPFVPADVIAVEKLFEEIAGDPGSAYFHPHPFSPDEASRVCRHSGGDLYLGAWLGGVLIGYGMLRGWDEGFDIPSLGICLSPTSRGLGLATVFMKGIHEQAKKAGATQILLKVHPENTVALSLYESLGYQFSEKKDDQLVGRVSLRNLENSDPSKEVI